MESKFIKRFLVISLLFIALVVFAVVLFDPFYHYHDAILGTKRILEERNYPLPGSIDHFTYDSVQVGSSVMENNSDQWFDEMFGCTSMKIAKGASSIADLNELINRSYKTHELKNVFFSIDASMLFDDPVSDMSDEDFYYLYDKNPLNDYNYLLNKDILFKKIPIQLAYSYVLPYDEGESYNWYNTKTFSAATVLSQYYPYEGFIEGTVREEMKANVDANVTTLEKLVSEHPETDFYFYFSPASILYLDSAYREGRLPEHFYSMEETVNRLCSYSNVKLFAPNTREDIILNLDNYMDSVHFSKSINYEIAVSLANGTDRVTSENIGEYLSDFEDIIVNFSRNTILDYYPDAVVD